MLSLTVLIFIQLFFCLLFFLYFRHRINQQLKLNEFKKEIDDIIILFNRQAERHISYLESLLDNEVFKNFKNPNSSESHNITSNLNPIQKDSNELSPPSPTNPNSENTSSSSKKNTKSVILDAPLLPVQAVHSFYSNFSTTSENTKAKPIKPPTMIKPIDKNSKNSNREPSNPINSSILKSNTLSQKVLYLFDKKLSNSQIAKHLGISTAEVKLILKLNEKIHHGGQS